MSRDLLSLAARLREYRANPHHVNPMSERYMRLTDQIIEELVNMAKLRHVSPREGVIGFRRPWGINTIGNMIAPPNIQTSHPELGYVRSVPEPYGKNWLEAIRAAWWVLTGKAEAVIWPSAGELEAALGTDTNTPKDGFALNALDPINW